MAMLSALAAAGAIFAAAVALHFGELPAFLTPATDLGEKTTIEGEMAGQAVELVASVPSAAKVGRPRVEAEREVDGQAQKLVTVSVRVRNDSTVPVEVAGGEQSLRTDRARSYDSRTKDAVAVAAGKARTLKLRFLVPDGEDPATLTLKVAGAQHKFDVS